MNRILLLFCFVLSTSVLWSQRYGTAMGIRMGTDWGLTLQQRLTKRITFEGIVQSSLQREEFILTGLIERHNPILGRRLNLYLGGGLHKGWFSSPDTESGSGVEDPFGITLVGGIEFTLGRINVGYDLKPAVNISGGARGFYTQSGISLRYVLIKDNVWRKNKRKKQRQKKKRQKKKRRRKRR